MHDVDACQLLFSTYGLNDQHQKSFGLTVAEGQDAIVP